MSMLDLHMLKDQFGGLMDRVTPWTESYFVMWLDMKVAEYKVLGHMRLQNKDESASKKSAANLSRGGGGSDGSDHSDDEDRPSWAKRRRRGRRRSAEEQEDLHDQDLCDIDENLRDMVAIIPASDSPRDIYSRTERSPGGSRTTILSDQPPTRLTPQQTFSQIERSHVGSVSSYSSAASSRLTSPRSVPQGYDKASDIAPSPSICTPTASHEDTESTGLNIKCEDEDDDDDDLIIIKEERVSPTASLHPVTVVANTSALQMRGAQMLGNLPLALDYQASTSRTHNLSSIDYEQYPSTDDMADVSLEESSLTDEDFYQQSQGQSDDSRLSSSIAAFAQLQSEGRLGEQVELVAGSGVYLPAQKYLMVKSMTQFKRSPKYAVTKLLGLFFDDKTLAMSCAVGGRDANVNKDIRFGAQRSTPLDPNILGAIKAFVLREYDDRSGLPAISDSEFNFTANIKCGNCRRTLKHTQAARKLNKHNVQEG